MQCITRVLWKCPVVVVMTVVMAPCCCFVLLQSLKNALTSTPRRASSRTRATCPSSWGPWTSAPPGRRSANTTRNTPVSCRLVCHVLYACNVLQNFEKHSHHAVSHTVVCHVHVCIHGCWETLPVSHTIVCHVHVFTAVEKHSYQSHSSLWCTCIHSCWETLLSVVCQHIHVFTAVEKCSCQPHSSSSCTCIHGCWETLLVSHTVFCHVHVFMVVEKHSCLSDSSLSSCTCMYSQLLRNTPVSHTVVHHVHVFRAVKKHACQS